MSLIGALVGGLLLYNAVSNEVTGVANYSEGTVARGVSLGHRIVTRKDSPSEFRSAPNEMWVGGSFFFAIATFGFLMYRKLNDVR